MSKWCAWDGYNISTDIIGSADIWTVPGYKVIFNVILPLECTGEESL